MVRLFEKYSYVENSVYEFDIFLYKTDETSENYLFCKSEKLIAQHHLEF